MAVTAIKAKNAVESLRDVVQDLLVPELKSLKVSQDSQRSETKIQFEAFRGEFDSFRSEMRSTVDAIRTEIRIRDEKQTQAIQALSDKLGILLEVRERLAVLEDRAKRT
jgi:hypothetical protein